MPIREFAPPFSPPDRIAPTLAERGFAVADATWVEALSGARRAELVALGREWDDLPPDPYLKDGGHYRRRRHASFVVDGATCRGVPHRAHFQSPEYNALHGGMQRWFEPMRSTITERPPWAALLTGLASLFGASGTRNPWYVEAHQFRIDTSDGIGRPTPEGAHRDGVDYVALFLVAREGIKGGETRVFEGDAPGGLRFTLKEPWSVLLIDDARVIHESTPIQPLSPGTNGHRDTLVLTYRRRGFQEA
jgi:hypothetical protein